MPLTIGARLGVYEISGPLGKGGMGEVYRARDTRLGREVAIKILPELFAADDARLARFEREAKTLASLNHPNIAQIHGVEEFVSSASSPGARTGISLALVMELVEGEDLSAIIQRASLPVREALAIARQIADALSTAHDRGVVHRDLKPSNIKVRDDGTVKVLDFGLAKLASDEQSAASGGPMSSPTVTSPATQLGVILGTAAYMAPEQAKGRPVDRRADAWAFGAVLYEMLTGRRAFEGEDISDTLAFVLTRDPDWTALPGETPEPIRRLLRRCLERDRAKRLDSLAAARLEIEDALGSPTPTAPAGAALARSSRLAPFLATAAAAAAIAAGGVWLALRPAAVDRPVIHLLATPLPPARLHIDAQTADFDVSPDGHRIAYLATRGDAASPELFIRRLDEGQPTLVPATTNAQHPFFSKDGEWVGFAQNNDLKKVSVHGGSAQTICAQCARGFRGAAFMDDGSVLVSSVGGRTGIRRIPAGGGTGEVLTAVDNEAGERMHRFPNPLPGSQALLFVLNTATDGSEWVITAQNKDGSRKRLTRGVQPRYVPSGHLLYVSEGTLFAVGFDPVRLEMIGNPVSVVNDVLTKSEGVADYALGRDGSLIYVGGGVIQLEFAVSLGGRQRGERARAVPRGTYVLARFSPDGRRVMLDSRSGDADFWIWDLREGTVDRFTFGPYVETYPVWAPDSSHVYFLSSGGNRAEGLYRQNADQPGGTPMLVAKMSREILPTSISPDGTLLVGHVTADASQLEAGVYMIPLKGDSTPKRITGLAPGAMNADISPDGKWIAYQAADSPGATPQVYVQPFPDVTAVRRQISPAGGTHPLWTRRTGELFFRDMQRRLMSVPVRLTPTFSKGEPVVIRDHPFVPGPGRAYDVSPDAQTIVMIDEVRSEGTAKMPPPQLHVLLNWVDDLKRRVPGGPGARYE
jgi:serine/threonine-protein kinase